MLYNLKTATVKVLFTAFPTSIREGSLPQRFTYPYKYTPDPLCEYAAKELQDYLTKQTDWMFNEHGRMFGVLVVQDAKGELGYFSAYAGKLPTTKTSSFFVPAVFDRNEIEKQFVLQKAEIETLEQQLDTLEKDPSFLNLKQQLFEQQITFEMALRAKQGEIVEARKARKKQREQGEKSLNKTALEVLSQRLNNETIEQKKLLQSWRNNEQRTLDSLQFELGEITNNINKLKN